MAEPMRAAIALTPAQLQQLHAATQGGQAHFPKGYALIHDWIKDDPAAQRDGTVFWFAQARGINGDDSLSARFIRRHTENGLDATGVPHGQRKDMQALSNDIAKKVLNDILKEGDVKPLADILHRDISIALDDGKVSLGGWGGAFYYWDMPFKSPDQPNYPRKADGSYHTVGDEIVRRGELPLLLATSAQTIAEMVQAGDIRWQDRGQVLDTAWNAGMPAPFKLLVSVRAAEILGRDTAQTLQDDLQRNYRELREEISCFLFRDLPQCPEAGARLTPQVQPSQESAPMPRLEDDPAAFLDRMLAAAQSGDDGTFRHMTQLAAQGEGGRQLRANAIAAVDQMEQQGRDEVLASQRALEHAGEAQRQRPPPMMM